VALPGPLCADLYERMPIGSTHSQRNEQNFIEFLSNNLRQKPSNCVLTKYMAAARSPLEEVFSRIAFRIK
jgi:hypothetical protein